MHCFLRIQQNQKERDYLKPGFEKERLYYEEKEIRKVLFNN